jgi:bla regulator protein blaR1
VTRLALLLLCFVSAFGQGPAFEAADVKPNRSGEARMAVDFQPGGRFTARNVPLRILIALANHVRPDAITGGPAWLGSERFDIVAKAAQTDAPEELRLMLVTLLAERFHLESHSESRPGSAYALRVAARGPKLQPVEEGPLSNQRCTPADAAPGRKRVACHQMTMALLADTLQEIAARDIDAPVVNQTALPGAYDFTLEWTPGLRSAAADAPLDVGPSLFDAVETQLGLKLQSEKLPLPVIVVDRVERVPVEN